MLTIMLKAIILPALVAGFAAGADLSGGSETFDSGSDGRGVRTDGGGVFDPPAVRLPETRYFCM
ncbi:MAG: hypothetical protein ACNYPE_16240 [Candidatus Azotimanducaceae bacterium WSBS_2022_MAG_OTU7]